MKKVILPCFLIVLIAISCKKSDDAANTTPDPDKYMSISAGSTWNYEQTNITPPAPATSYTVTSSTRDTIVGTRSYHVFTNSNGTTQYYNISGNSYYSYQSLPAALGGAKVENLYLKDNAAVNESWDQNFSVTYSGFPVTVAVTNKIVEKGISKTVGTITYSNVIHVVTTIAVPGLPPGTLTLTTNINNYYAPKKGMIESDNQIDFTFMGTTNSSNTQTKLTSATIL